MSALALPFAALAAATPSPSPSPAKQLDVTTVTPGLVGFIATFALVLVAIGLFLLMTRSLRRTTRNARVQGLEVAESARGVQHGRLPVRAPEPTVPGVLDGGAPFAAPGSAPHDGETDGDGSAPRP
ncbi:hypothetical protein [Xylanimonas sp. McL0601]|uniref:hypothetical protein n=1 Tax=Xylanimonas sp. McL0601 TaxID=3414739 RepID=UPI003CEAB90A